MKPLRSLTERLEFSQGVFLELQVRLDVLMGGFESLVAEPQRDGGHVDAGPGAGASRWCGDDVRRHALGVQARTSLASSPAGLIEAEGDALPRQAVAARVAERIVGRGFAPSSSNHWRRQRLVLVQGEPPAACGPFRRAERPRWGRSVAGSAARQ